VPVRLTSQRIEELRNNILKVLNYEFNWMVDDIEFVNNGVVNAVFLIKEKNLGQLAVRTPWTMEEYAEENEASEITSLIKESTIADHCYKYNIPVPKIHKLHLSEEINFLVSDFILRDDSIFLLLILDSSFPKYIKYLWMAYLLLIKKTEV
jgi:hypothetical protein